MKSAITIVIPFGRDPVEIHAPVPIETLKIHHLPPLDHIYERLRAALDHPIGTDPLKGIIRKIGKSGSVSVAITVSDITRPVPYKDADGILVHLLEYLEECGIRRENIVLIVATGMHRPSTREEKIAMFGEEVADQCTIIDHDCDDRANLISIGTTKSGASVSVNKTFYSADVKICTGLVESHFMAGFSGGRKSVCPGLVDKATIEKFHGPAFLEDPRAANLVLHGNPCHDEALEVAKRVGIDFILNVTVDASFRVTGIYAGDLEEAHRQACKDAARVAGISIDREYDIVLTHGGRVGINHYQTAKAAVGALPALKKGGALIIAVDNCDPEPVGGPEYRSLLHLLKMQGPDGYVNLLLSPWWQFTKDQWEPEMWSKVVSKVGETGIIYCAPQISREQFASIPGTSGYGFVHYDPARASAETARLMVQNSLDNAVAQFSVIHGKLPSIAFVKDGPYSVPLFSKP
jgi:lactate racemase